jgi:hypothetical protein
LLEIMGLRQLSNIYRQKQFGYKLKILNLIKKTK